MLHTPPTRNDWKSDASVAKTYSVVESSGTTESLPGGATLELSNSNLSLSHNVSETLNLEENDFKITSALKESQGDDTILESFETPDPSDLPMDLLQLYETFLKELKEPKFERALAVCEISDLFQSFYQRFHSKVLNSINSETQFELTESDSSKTSIYYKYNLLIERLLCETFYHQISSPSKRIPIDEFEKNVILRFSSKLECLTNLDIHFNNLDIELPAEIENEFLNEIKNKILSEFELMITEHSPTLKMKYLMKIHKLLGDIIKQLTNSIGLEYVLNTDIYLPVLIFSVIKLSDLSNHFLVSQLLIIKRFANEFIFQYDDDLLQEERGKLLYVSANFEACISYISSVTLENLNIDQSSISGISNKSPSDIISILNSNIGLDLIEDEVEDFKKFNPPLPDITTMNWVDYSKLALPESVLHSDQGLKSISNAVDTSIRNIMGKVPWLGSGSSEDVLKGNNNTTDNEIFSNSLLQQLEENVAFKEKNNNEVTPTSSVSSTGNEAQALNHVSNENSNGKTPFPTVNTNPNTQDQVNAIEGEPRVTRTSSTQDRLMNRFTTSVGGVMKNLRPMSTSSSSTSLNVTTDGNIPNQKIISPIKTRQQLQQQQQQQNLQLGGNTIRSRTTSFINSSIFGSPTSSSNQLNGSSHESLSGNGGNGHQRTNSIFSALETAISANRSRGNSIPSSKTVIPEDEGKLLEEISRLKKFEVTFEELSVKELREVYDNYQFIMNKISKC